MYIIKNALRCIGRSKGRNILIGIIALVIAVSSCLGLSIRQAAESAKESAMEGMSITASISYDRAGQMGEMAKGGGGGGFSGGGMSFDKSQFSEMMGNASSLSLEEYKLYATAESVQDSYYTLTVYVDGSDAFLPVSDEEEEDSEAGGTLSGGESAPSGFPGGMGDMFGGFSSGDFTIVGYSGDIAMTEFVAGNVAVSGGSIFEEGTNDCTCVISEELAIYNNLSVGDSIVVTNPSVETETYTLTVSGIYASSSNNDFSMSAFGKSQDPANQIYMSANALQTILDASASGESEDGSALTGSLSFTYTFADVDAYNAFEAEARALGLDDSYVISSTDMTAFENSLAPLETLSNLAKWFLIVILAIGGVILVVLNIFSVRERKYEVGVLTAMGMKKWKVALQFMCEILVITMVAVVIGAGVGAVSSVPVTNALLETQVESQNTKQTQAENNFGRSGNFGGGMGGGTGGMSMPDNLPDDVSEKFSGNNPFENMFERASDYVTEVDSAMNLTVALEMLGVGLLLTLAASAASVLFIMRYDPLKILANRD